MNTPTVANLKDWIERAPAATARTRGTPFAWMLADGVACRDCVSRAMLRGFTFPGIQPIYENLWIRCDCCGDEINYQETSNGQT